MKKVIIILFAVLLSVVTFAQDKTISVLMPENTTYTKYTFSTADTLGPVSQDTIDVVITYQSAGYVKKLAVKTRFDIVSGADTTVNISVFGKEFSDDGTYVQIIAAAASSDINANNTSTIITSDWTETVAQYTSTVATTTDSLDADVSAIAYVDTSSGDSIVTTWTLEKPAQTITNAAQTVTPLDKSYRLYRVRYIMSLTSALGSGVRLDELEFKIYTN